MLGAAGKFGDLGQLLDVGQTAGGVGLADSAGDGAVFGKRVLEREADHRVVGRAHVEVLQVTAEDRVGVLAVEVVGVDDGEGCVDGLAGAEDGVRRAPRLLASGRHGVSGRQLVDGLEGEADVDAAGELRGDTFAEILFEIRADDEDHLAEAGAQGVEDGIIEDGLAGRAHRVDLLQAAVTAAHAGGEDEEGGFHVREIGGVVRSRRPSAGR